MVILWMVYYYITRFLNLCKNLGIDWKTPPLDGSWEWFLESLWNFKKHQPRRWSWGTGNVLGEIHNTWWFSQPEGSFTGLFTQLLPEQNKHLSRGGSDVKPLCHPHLRPVRAPVECLLRFGPDTKAFFCGCFFVESFKLREQKPPSQSVIRFYIIIPYSEHVCFFSWSLFLGNISVRVSGYNWNGSKTFFFRCGEPGSPSSSTICMRMRMAQYGISKSHQEQKWLAQKAR